MTTSVAALEAFFSYQTNGLHEKSVTDCIVGLRRWAKKIMGDAIDPTQIADKYVMASLRSQFAPDLKHFLGIKEPNTVHEFEALLRQWELTHPYRKSILNKFSVQQRT